MTFCEERFPDDISRGARGGPERRTQVVELASGFEERNASWAQSRRRFDVAYGIRRADDLARVVAFFEARRGRLQAFRFKDWSDYKSCLPSVRVSELDQQIGIGDGTIGVLWSVAVVAEIAIFWAMGRRASSSMAAASWPLSSATSVHPSGRTGAEITGIGLLPPPPQSG